MWCGIRQHLHERFLRNQAAKGNVLHVTSRDVFTRGYLPMLTCPDASGRSTERSQLYGQYTRAVHEVELPLQRSKQWPLIVLYGSLRLF